MKAVILAGGFGTRLSEETVVRPKPLVEIGGRPILWHIMKIYSAHGINDFVIALGYRGSMIKEYFFHYARNASDVTLDLKHERLTVHRSRAEPWSITLVDTGDATMTGGRLRRVREYVDDAPFCFTYGDGVADVDIRASIAFHAAQKRLATITLVRLRGRFGAVEVEGSRVTRFQEKPLSDWVSGGFFVLDPRVLEYIEGDAVEWERGPIERLAAESHLSAYLHSGFWHPLDSMRDKAVLDELWASGKAPWKLWD